MSEEIVLKLLGNIGVPAAVCFYTLFEVNKNVKRLADSIDRFGSEVDKRIDRIEKDVKDLAFEVKSLAQKI